MSSPSAIHNVPLLDLKRLDDDERRELRAAFERVFASGYYIMGPEVTGFEAEAAAYIGSTHAIGVSSGTDALIATLMALCIGPGDEVICPTYTFFATAGSIWRVGAKPVFVDCDPVTYNIDDAAVERAITDRTRAIMPVHLFGQAAKMDETLRLARQHDLAVIEDAAQAIGTKRGDRSVGAIGTAGCFSFFPSKNLGCMGDGGLITTDDDELAALLRSTRNHGMEPKYYHHFVGGNFRLDALQAAFLRVKLPRLERAHAGRRENAARYDAGLSAAGVGVAHHDTDAIGPGRVGLPVRVEPSHIYNQYTLRIPGGGRDALRAHLADAGIGSEVYYPVPMHMQDCFSSLGYEPGAFPHAERAARESLALPIFPELKTGEIDRVIDEVARWCRTVT